MERKFNHLPVTKTNLPCITELYSKHFTNDFYTLRFVYYECKNAFTLTGAMLEDNDV